METCNKTSINVTSLLLNLGKFVPGQTENLNSSQLGGFVQCKLNLIYTSRCKMACLTPSVIDFHLLGE